MILDPLILLIDLLAVYRLTRLIVRDTLFQEARWKILQRWPSSVTTFPDAIVEDKGNVDGHSYGRVGSQVVFLSNKTDEDGDPVWLPERTYKWTELIECPYCASVWVAFGVVALRVWWDWWQYPALALALAGGVALIFSKLDTE